MTQNTPQTGCGSQAHVVEAPLPMNREEMALRGWDELDILLITGDAYIDHPAFGVPLIGRWLAAHGYRVGVVAQPRWDCPDDITVMGRPRLFAGIAAGAMDSMLAHFTSFRKKRHDDAYTPGGQAGSRPNRATIVYTSLTRSAFPDLPVVIGGIEASLRRATHYEFWTDKMRRSVLLDSKADVLVYGMGERAALEIAQRLERIPPQVKNPARFLKGIRGTAFTIPSLEALRALKEGPGEEEVIHIASHEDILSDPVNLMDATLAIERQVHQGVKWAAQACGDRVVAFAPPAEPLTTPEMDALYDLPYTRAPHTRYTQEIPAATMIQFSVTSHRGCAAGCTFCSITLHQGREIGSRSAESIEREVTSLTKHKDFKGSISDVGGPTANMWGARCADDPHTCRRNDCLTPVRCPHFVTDDEKLVELLRKLKNIDGVKHLRVSSGVRYDMTGGDGAYLKALVSEFVGGQLKIAPEHLDDNVLKLMRKPAFHKFEKFMKIFENENKNAHKEQYVIPYLISAFPGCTDEDMRQLSEWLQARNWQPKQVQCFIPTPGSVATAMFYAGVDTKKKPLYVARTNEERLRQHRILVPNHGAPEKRKQTASWQ